MTKLLVISALFALAGLCEIGGGYLVWGWMREGRHFAWVLLGAAILALYGVVGRSTTYNRVQAGLRRLRWHIHRSLAWGMAVDRFRPDRYDIAGALICVVGVAVMIAPSRS